MTTSRSETVTFVLSLLESKFWILNPCFGPWEIIWDHFQKSQTHLKVKNRVEGRRFLVLRRQMGCILPKQRQNLNEERPSI